MTFWKRQNYGNNKKIRVCQGLGEKDRETSRGFLSAVKLTCNDTTMVDTCHYTFVKIPKIDNTKKEI